MRDIIYNFDDNELLKELGIDPLVIDKDIFIIRSLKDHKKGSLILDMSELDMTQVQFVTLIKSLKPFAVFNAELNSKKDFIHHRGSGMNHVMFNSLKDYKVNYILNIQNLNNPIYMGRAIQNIFLARKSHVRIIVSSFAKNNTELYDKKDMQGLLRLLGMDTKDIKNAFL